MALHLIKLAVGIEDPEDLGPRQERWKNARGNYQHRTRMTPTRGADVLAGGSLYCVIKGVIQVRQPIYGTSVGRGRHYMNLLSPLISALEGAS